ncbi:integration host factor subunit alpha [Desulfobacterota bacterium M19]
MSKENITRQTLTKAINDRLGFPQNDAGDMVDYFFTAIKESLLKGENVKLVNFGAFKVKTKAPRRGRNPQTGETLEIAARNMVSFKPSKTLRDTVNEGGIDR